MPRLTGPLPDNILKRMSPQDRPKGPAGMTAEECAAKSTAKAEKELQQQIRALLDRLGIWYHWSRMDKKTTCRKGTPDFLFVVVEHACGLEIRKPVAFECKVGGASLSPEQEQVRTIMDNNGWCYSIIRSYDEALCVLMNLGIEGM